MSGPTSGGFGKHIRREKRDFASKGGRLRPQTSSPSEAQRDPSNVPRLSVDELEVVRLHGRGRAPRVVNQPRCDEFQVRGTERVERRNGFVRDDGEQHLHRSHGARVGRQRDAEGRRIAARVDLCFQLMHEAVVVDEDQIDTTPFQIRDRPQQRLSWSDLVVLQRQPGRLSPVRRRRGGRDRGQDTARR